MSFDDYRIRDVFYAPAVGFCKSTTSGENQPNAVALSNETTDDYA